MAGLLEREYPNFSGPVTDSGPQNRNPGAHLLETCSWKGYANEQCMIISDVVLGLEPLLKLHWY